ncbi:hypothetical protein [Deinococcus phoenicis]|uniref:hypothetical protein n=1 Tax=Deinococcus phoenicis TaxID=1476583 RepID=UPI001268F9F5|nr:hypothetical protein [Deinococcus phoenicis]
MKVDIEALSELALAALGEAMRARAQARVAFAVLQQIGVPQEAFEEAYFINAVDVAEEMRELLKQGRVSPEVVDAINDRFLELPNSSDPSPKPPAN